MMRTIYKYQLEVTDRQMVSMPSGARILTVQMQHGTPCLWAEVNADAMDTVRLIEMFGTGHEIPNLDDATRDYIGTIQIHGGSLVFHVYERA